MKLIFCKKCQDVIRLIQEEKRTCRCGECSGQYTDELRAWYKGDAAVPLGFNGTSFVNAIENQPAKGFGKDFTAFTIAKKCDTFTKIV